MRLQTCPEQPLLNKNATTTAMAISEQRSVGSPTPREWIRHTQLRVTVEVGSRWECVGDNECDNSKDKRGITREQNGNDVVVSALLLLASQKKFRW
jgi:hypothetical protein